MSNPLCYSSLGSVVTSDYVTPLTPWGCLAFAIKLEHPTVRRGSLDPIALQGIFAVWNRRVPHGIKIATFRDDGEVEEVFTSTTVNSRHGVPSVRRCWYEVSN